MLVTVPPLKPDIFSKGFHNSHRQNEMKNGSTGDRLVLTLEDDISDEVLKCKSNEDTASGSSSVALWIKSLKEHNVTFDDSGHDSHGCTYSGSCSDQDDLQLGAEANDVGKKHKTRKRPSSLSQSRDSDSDSSYNRWYSWTGRRSFLTNRLSYDRSLDSDTSGLSSVTSVSSLLTARESDPEDILKGLGFRGPTVLDKIPHRFISTGTICDGVDSEGFLSSVQDECDETMTNSEVPPWVMARFDDIPKKFWNQKEDPADCTDGEQGGSLINEPPQDETKEETGSRPPRTFHPKFGTYLEPVTEEAELSSQGSASLSPMRGSFESTRSTLKANSQDGPDNVAKIPSLCDLWGASEDEEQVNSEAVRSDEHGIVCDNTGENIPTSNIPGEVDRGYNGDWIDKTRDGSTVDAWSSAPSLADLQQSESNPVNPWNSTPSIADIQQCESSLVNPWSSTPSISDINSTTVENIPAITSDQWCSSTTNSVPTLSSYLSVTDDGRNSSERETMNSKCLDFANSEKLTNAENSDSEAILIPKQPPLRIPTVTISEPVEKGRKISTVVPPDIDKLLPLILPEKSKQTDSALRSKKTDTKEKAFSDGKRTEATQINLYGTQNWATIENSRKPQVQFSDKGRAKNTRKVLTRNRKTANNKATVSVSQCNRKTQQVNVLEENYCTKISCFSNLSLDCSYEPCSETVTSSFQPRGYFGNTRTSTVQESDGFKASDKPSPPLGQVENSSELWSFGQSEQSSAVQKSRKNERQDEMRTKDSCSEECLSSKKEVRPCGGIGYSATKYSTHLSTGKSVEEELDELQNSLKGVKMYKAGIHLMQLASSVETVVCSEKRPKRLQARSSERLLDSIQNELKRLEEYILRLQGQLTKVKNQADTKEEQNTEVHRRGSDFSDITRQLLQEQLKMFNSISSSAVSPTSTPSVSREPSLCSDTPDVLRHTDVMKLRKEMQQLRQDSVELNASMKEEILSEVRSEIRKCFEEFLRTKS